MTDCCHGKSHSHDYRPAKEWFCPMCEGVESDRPGACPKCGMALERNPAFVRASVYSCPMHPEVRQNRPGDCPKCGMALEAVAGEPVEDRSELDDMTRRFWVGMVLSLPVLVLAMGAHFPPIDSVPPQISAWLQFLLATPVVVWAGAPFFARGFRSLVSGHLNMFTLIALGTGAAFCFSLFALLAPGLLPHTMRHGGMVPVYFEASAVIIVLVLLGQVLELRARASTGEAIRGLLGLAPKIAHRVVDGRESDIPLDAISVGDVLRVKPGEKIPVDGVVIDGRSSVDESMLTGESVPLVKEPAATVAAGTINGTGSFLMRAEKIGSETMLSQIVQMVSDAQRSRAPIQRLADAVAGWFVPVVVVVAVITFVVWWFFGPTPALAYALANAVAVLIIACPCALGLATPMSIMVGVGRGSRMGILVRDAEALERMEKVTTVVLDKTGTLTEGQPEVTSVVSAGGFEQDRVLAVAAALEGVSEHPLGAAIVRAAEKLSIPTPADFESVTGMGVRGRIDGVEVLVGRRAMLETAGVTALSDLSVSDESLGQTVVWVAIGGRVAGVLSLADALKPTTPSAIRALHDLGLRVVMLTGDNRATAEKIARETGIDEVRAEVTPVEKQKEITRLREQGAVVAMAGDGVNDAPALAAADVGIAMGTGTEIAMHTAGVTLIKGDLRGIVQAIALSRATMRNIRQNLAFAFLYNALGIPLAAGLLYPVFGLLLSPIFASAAMALSSVSVIGNALRLKRTPLPDGAS